MATHTILGGKVRLYRRGEGDNWHCSTYYEGREHRKSTKADTLDRAEEIAEDWYLELRGKVRAGIAIGPTGKTFDKAADAFEEEYEVITEGERSPKHVASHKANLKNHLRPFLGKMPVAEINGDTAQAYRVHRIKTATEKYGKPPARNTLHNEIITLRLVLKGAVRKGWRESVPDLSAPYKKQMKIIHRPWFSPDEYKKLYKATRANAQKQTARGRDKWAAEQLHDKVLFLGNTGSRTDKIRSLNDTFRQSLVRGGQCVLTAGVAALGSDMIETILTTVKSFDAFTADNDPYGEHDFGSFQVGMDRFFWKIDYYDTTLAYGSEDPAEIDAGSGGLAFGPAVIG